MVEEWAEEERGIRSEIRNQEFPRTPALLRSQTVSAHSGGVGNCYIPSQKMKERPPGSPDMDASLEHPEERPEVLLLAVPATPQLGRDLSDRKRSGRRAWEPGLICDSVGDSEDAWKGTKEAPDEVEGVRPGIRMTRGKNNKDKQDPEVFWNEDEIEGRLSP
ncbi:hypothetical protein DFH07DRAFT_780860 [Mycena maculata]|uniref:Uncharacterized protein n=1 Tax=Mycena maculata TaxID=230809 RepID=A0AAD7MU54_9AGAR|nr:hypothetical protein DFH07DRAFT_780860 [Mycena maculata]